MSVEIDDVDLDFWDATLEEVLSWFDFWEWEDDENV